MLALLKLIPLRDWLYLAIIAAILGGAYALYSHGETVQKQKDAEAGEKLRQAQIVHKQQVEDRAQQLTTAAIDKYKATLAAPPASDAPHSVCYNTTPKRSSVPADAGHRQDSAAKADQSSQGASDNAADIPFIFDPGPALDKTLQDADAQITVLQDYINACIAASICKAPAP